MTGRLLVSVFEREDDVVQATTAARKEGLEIVDVYAPYAVHGLDRAMGLPPSRLPWVCFLLGLFGAVTMTAFQFWASVVSWPINVGGKPWNSLPAFVPAIFEITVLCGDEGTVLPFLWRAGMMSALQPAISARRGSDHVAVPVLRTTLPTYLRSAVASP